MRIAEVVHCVILVISFAIDPLDETHQRCVQRELEDADAGHGVYMEEGYEWD